MKEFALIFRMEDLSDFQPTTRQLQERLSWLSAVKEQGKLVDKGNTLLPFTGSAKSINNKKEVTDGVNTGSEGFITGYVVIKAETIDEAVEIAKGNPIFDQVDGHIEIRELLKRG